MVKASASAFVCQACGAVHAKWAGRCEACGEWNTLVEEASSAPPGALKAGKTPARRGPKTEFIALNSDVETPPRVLIGVEELDRVFGGGIVPSSATLIGGDHGIGKSTLLPQAAARLARNGVKTVYVSGEEAAAQIQERARRLKVANSPVQLATETDLRKILSALKEADPGFVVIDSIQTVWSDALEAAPGSVAQVRACAQELVRWAKKSGAALVLVGHVTK